MAAANTNSILTEKQVEGLKAVKKSTCWDPLHLHVVDVEGKVEKLRETVDMVTSTSNPPSLLVMLNTGEMMKSKEAGYWPNYKLMRRTGGEHSEDIVAQAQFSLEFTEFQGRTIFNSMGIKDECRII